MKIQNKLFMMLFSCSLILIISLTALFQWSIANGLVNYVHKKELESITPLISALAKEHQRAGNWATISEHPKRFDRLVFRTLDANLQTERPQPEHLRPSMEGGPPRGPGPDFPPENGPQSADPDERFNRPPPPPPRGSQPPHNKPGYALFDAQKQFIIGHFAAEFDYSYTPIKANNNVIGYLAVAKRDYLATGYELDLFEQQQSAFWLIGFVSMILVTAIALPMAQHLVKPIKEINNGMHQLTKHNYSKRITLARKDEIGQLANDYNTLATTLADTDQNRKKWLASISHELRTPVAIMRGELEAMLDNIRPLNLSNIESIHEEVKHLQCLIDDLYQLTSADIGAMHCLTEPLDLAEFIPHEMSKYQGFLSDANIQLSLNMPDKRIIINADKTRLCQLFENIINNCSKYANASQLHIHLALTGDKSQVLLNIEDDGIGVAENHLPHLFDHLYRIDESRNKSLGGAGLGLSICKQIIEAHHGSIWAQTSTMGGLSINIELPIYSKSGGQDG